MRELELREQDAVNGGSLTGAVTVAAAVTVGAALGVLAAPAVGTVAAVGAIAGAISGGGHAFFLFNALN
jgi:hypothetical protein